MTVDRLAVFKDTCSQLQDKKNSTRETALHTLLPHVIQCPEIDEQLENLLLCTISALEKGSAVPTACQIIERIVALNPLLPGLRPVIATLIDAMQKQLKASQPLHFTALFRCIGWVLALVSTFNRDFTDCSQYSTQLFTILTTALRYESKLYYDHALNLIAGLTSLYISLIPPYKAGWGYERFVSLLLFFMTKNYNSELATRVFAVSLNGLLLAIQYKNDPTLVPMYPEEIVSSYADAASDDHTVDDGYYLPLEDNGNDDEIHIPIIDWSFPHLVERVKTIFDGDTMSLENEYSEADLDMFASTISNDLDNVQSQMTLAQQTRNNPNVDQAALTKSNLILPELYNTKHPLNHHFPDHYTSYDGRALYFLLDIFQLVWSQLLNWPYVGELFTSNAIRQRCQDELSKALKSEHPPTTTYERRMGKKEQDVSIRAARGEKLAQFTDLADNELDVSGL